MSLNLDQNRTCVRTIFSDVRGYFEISLFEISRVDCIQEVKCSDLALLSVQNELAHQIS